MASAFMLHDKVFPPPFRWAANVPQQSRVSHRERNLKWAGSRTGARLRRRNHRCHRESGTGGEGIAALVSDTGERITAIFSLMLPGSVPNCWGRALITSLFSQLTLIQIVFCDRGRRTAGFAQLGFRIESHSFAQKLSSSWHHRVYEPLFFFS